MDTPERLLDPSESPTPQAPENVIPLNTELAFPFGINPITVRDPRWCVRVDNFPVGTPGRHPYPTFPHETNSGTLGTSPGNEK